MKSKKKIFVLWILLLISIPLFLLIGESQDEIVYVTTTGKAYHSELYRVNIFDLKKSSDANIDLMLQANVIKHIDGDTVRVRFSNPPKGLSSEETIRLLGVDTPETVHPNKAAQRFGKEASEYTENSLLGKDVYIAFDWSLRDRYKRLLAYIYTESGSCFNAILIQEGYGHAYLRYPFQFMEEFKLLEQEARQQKRGLWAIQ
jgi:micrococcal nuclease